ncbi:MAG: class II fumarate hydratase [Myxococcota bacterium]
MTSYRIETDSMGPVRVPVDAYYGAQTQRAVENFAISGIRFSRRFIQALGLIKSAAAATNRDLGELEPRLADAIERAADEVREGSLDEHFPVDIFQTGSGTSTHMNANEVIAARATEHLGGKRGSGLVHPNDHVNRGQSSNDVIPSAMHIAVRQALIEELGPALEHLQQALAQKAAELDSIVKIGRTHLQDATPVRLGQVFGGYAAQAQASAGRACRAADALRELALGGTAVGTGLNTHPEFARRTIARISEETGQAYEEARNHFEAQSARDAAVEASGELKAIACSLMRIANDLRHLASGPRGGFGEIRLPAVQPGSSIMPGKVNPVICEAVTMVSAQVVGNDASVTVGGLWGQFELNAFVPVIAHNLLQSTELLARVARVFADRCVSGIEADEERCRSLIERSLAMGTALAPAIGYDAAAAITKEAYESGRTIREVAMERSALDPEELERLLDPMRQTGA